MGDDDDEQYLLAPVLLGSHEEAQWVSLSDLMTGLMMIFLLLAILFMIKVQAEAKNAQEQLAVAYDMIKNQEQQVQALRDGRNTPDARTFSHLSPASRRTSTINGMETVAQQAAAANSQRVAAAWDNSPDMSKDVDVETLMASSIASNPAAAKNNNPNVAQMAYADNTGSSGESFMAAHDNYTTTPQKKAKKRKQPKHTDGYGKTHSTGKTCSLEPVSGSAGETSSASAAVATVPSMPIAPLAQP